MPDQITPNDANDGGDPGTLFPSLDGTGGGDQPKAADITGLLLNDLEPSSEGGDDGDGYQQSDQDTSGRWQPQSAGDDPIQDDGQQVAGGQIEPPKQRRRRSAKDRISQLTRKYHQEQDARGQVESQLAEVLGHLKNQSQEIQRLRSMPAPVRQRQAQTDDNLGLDAVGNDQQQIQTPNQSSLSANEIAEIVNSAVSKQFGEMRKATDEQNRLNTAHDASFREAAQEFPELNDARTKAHQLFMELYQSSPLRSLPDGPYQIALQVRGLLADEAQNPRAQPNVEARKVAASVVPVASSQPVGTTSPAQVNAIKKKIAALNHEVTMGNTDPRIYVELRKLSRGLNALTQKKR